MHEDAEFWHMIDAPVRWIVGGPVETRFDRPLGYLEIGILLFMALVAVIVWDEIVNYWREQSRRMEQQQWRRRLQKRNRRMSSTQRRNSEDGHVER